MNILAGAYSPNEGRLFIAGQEQPDYSVGRAQQLGIRCVFQELSLCPNLMVAENTRVTHPGLRGLGWRGSAKTLITDKLDEIVPGVGHKHVRQSKDLLIVGSYPANAGQYDEPRPAEIDHEAAVERIVKVRLPATDPAYGRAGPLFRVWRR